MDIEKMTEEWIDEINKKREEIILEKLKEMGIKFNLEKEQQKRFKKIQIEVKEGETSYYYNNGSINGKRIVTFVNEQDPIVRKSGYTDKQMKFEYVEYYY